MSLSSFSCPCAAARPAEVRRMQRPRRRVHLSRPRRHSAKTGGGGGRGRGRGGASLTAVEMVLLGLLLSLRTKSWEAAKTRQGRGGAVVGCRREKGKGKDGIFGSIHRPQPCLGFWLLISQTLCSCLENAIKFLGNGLLSFVLSFSSHRRGSFGPFPRSPSPFSLGEGGEK